MTHAELKSVIGTLCFCGGNITYEAEGDILMPKCSNRCSPNDIIMNAFRPKPTGEEIVTAFDGCIFTTQLLRETLKAFDISIRRNEISGDVEITGIPDNWSKENAENNLPVMLLDILKTARVKGVTKNAVCDALDVVSDESRYNPVKELLQSTAWDEVNRMPVIYEILGVKDTFSMQIIWKWLQQTVAMAFNTAAHPYGADGVLVLQGAQGIGKTSFFRVIVPKSLQSLFKEGAEIDPRAKDTIIQSTSHWITELGELERTTKRDQASLKAILTAAVDQYRTPYARNAIKRPRRTSFCGTVNPGEYLTDETGSRRFWTIAVDKIDLDKLFNLSDDFILQLWVQAYAEWRENPQGFRLSGSERAWLEKTNETFAKPLPYELEIRDKFDENMSVEQWGIYTPADVAKLFDVFVPAEKVGRVLSKLAREDSRINKWRTKHGWNYQLPIRNVGV